MGKEGKIPGQVIYVCSGGDCRKNGSRDISKKLKSLIKDNDLKGKVEIIKTDCTDRCKHAPIFAIQPQNCWFSHRKTNDQLEEIFKNHLLTQSKKTA